MNKKVIIVSKTHLDLGFTDYASVIREKYLNDFIPAAIEIASAVNDNIHKRFVWTTGSWLLNQALSFGSDELKVSLAAALKRGDIVAHAYPFTTHTELLDSDTLEYGLSLIDNIDKVSGIKTISAKMTDVPGHTSALVPYLAKKGIKLLHIGVNGASAVPDVPQCFLWEKDGYQIVVIYSGDYGGEFKSEFIDDILYFDHTLDNHGVRNAQAVIDNYNKLAEKYQGYEVIAGGMDYIADKLWAVKDKLPIITSEIGDSWIHGAATDPYKVAALRELQALKQAWLSDGTLTKDSDEYITLSDNLLCICEHTWGMDMKCHFGDYEHYLRKDFEMARQRDKVKITHIFRDFPHNFNNFLARLKGEYKKGSYRAIEKSWAEQRGYITQAMSALSKSHADEAATRLAALLPAEYVKEDGKPLYINKPYRFGNYTISINSFGGIGTLYYNDDPIINSNEKAVAEYHSYGLKDYTFWFNHYTRDAVKNKNWAFGDFGRPLLKYVDKKYRQGRFSYTLDQGKITENKEGVTIYADLIAEDYINLKLGAPKRIQLIYKLTSKGLQINLVWLDKPASRLTESTHFRLFPNAKSGTVFYKKLDALINPYDIVVNGNRNIAAVNGVEYAVNGSKVSICNIHSLLVGLGRGKILQFDNEYEDVAADGISFILHNNVWGTNFPLWYEGNASFEFTISANLQSKNQQ